MFDALEKKVLLCCFSNVAVNTLTEILNETNLTLRALRFYSMSKEVFAVNIKTKHHRKALTEVDTVESIYLSADNEVDVDFAEMQVSDTLISLTFFLAK